MGLNWDKMKEDLRKISDASKELEEGNEKSEKKDFSDLLGLDDEDQDEDLSENSQEYEIKRLEARVDSLEKIVKTLIDELEDQKS
jgi:hypothetical protein